MRKFNVDSWQSQQGEVFAGLRGRCCLGGVRGWGGGGGGGMFWGLCSPSAQVFIQTAKNVHKLTGRQELNSA